MRCAVAAAITLAAASAAQAQKVRSSGLLYTGVRLTYAVCYIYNLGPTAVTLLSATLRAGGVDVSRSRTCGSTLAAGRLCSIFGITAAYQYAQCDVSAPASATLRASLVLLPGSSNRPVNVTPLR